VTVLSDGILARNYGPVFANGVKNGVYKVDLGTASQVSEISTWSFNMRGDRGPQKFTLFGIDKNNARCPITAVNTLNNRQAKFTGTRIQLSDGGVLGMFNGLEWHVEPVTNPDANTAFQELQVK